MEPKMVSVPTAETLEQLTAEIQDGVVEIADWVYKIRSKLLGNEDPIGEEKTRNCGTDCLYGRLVAINDSLKRIDRDLLNIESRI